MNKIKVFLLLMFFFGQLALAGLGQETPDQTPIDKWARVLVRYSQDFLKEMLNTDEGARGLGELGIGTNYGIKRFTKNMLFDEKIGGTIHLALGHGLSESGGVNASAIHWDSPCDMSQGEILVDGELFYKNGRFIK